MGERREVYGRRKDGSEFPASIDFKAGIGKRNDLTVMLRDITARKSAHEALLASEPALLES